MFYERLQLASSQFLKKVKALDYTKAMDIEGLRDTGRNIMDSFHEHEKVSIKHGHMEDFSRQLSKAFYALETKAVEEPAEQPLDLRVLLNILFKAAEEHSQTGQQDPQQSGLLVTELLSIRGAGQ